MNARLPERRLFLALVLLQLVPFWAVAHVPTTDGPSHVYNAWIVDRLTGPGGDARLAEVFAIDRRPLPNWLGHALLAVLLRISTPATAEKILVSTYAVLFLYGARYLAGAVDPERRGLALLAFPLVWNQTFQLGFYNFGLSLGLSLWIVGLWWRYRAAPGPGFALGINGLFLLCYFAHIFSTLLALAMIGVLWCLTWRGAETRIHLRHLAILAPPALLAAWYAGGHSSPIPATTSFWVQLRYLVRMEVLLTFSERQLWLGALLAVLFGGLAIATLAGRFAGRPRPFRWREEDGFLLLALAFAAVYFVSPEGASGGVLLKNRLSLYPWLLLLPWLRPPRGWLTALLVLLAGGTAVAQAGWYRAADRDITAFLAATHGIAPETRVLPLLFDRRASVGVVGLLGHAFDYAAIDKRLLDWTNYEAATGHFPVNWKAGAAHPDVFTVEAAPGDIDVEPFREQIDYVFCWKMPPGSPLHERLIHHYALVEEKGPARLYERRTRVRARHEPPGPD